MFKPLLQRYRDWMQQVDLSGVHYTQALDNLKRSKIRYLLTTSFQVLK